jgi:uncharacterized membrane protein
MREFAAYAAKALGVRLPEDYAGFMETYKQRFPEDPVHEKSWIGGLGSPDFVVGTTLAFRSKVPKFQRANVVIGYVGPKAIIINKMHEEIDEYLVLNTRDGSLLAIDYRGVTNEVATSFEEWITPELLRATLREKYASNLTVVVFDDEQKAKEARRKLLQLQRQGSVELEDAVVVVKEQGGSVRSHQLQKPARKGLTIGSITGFIVRSIFFAPLFGGATGTSMTGLVDVGIEDRFMHDLAHKFAPGSSALFTLVRKAEPERVTEAFLGFGGKVLVNSVSKEKETEIQRLLDAAPAGTE